MVEMRRVMVVVACVVGVLWLAPVTRTARAAPGLAPGAAAGGAAVGGRSALADFNADTYADLAVGVPFEEDRSGVVNVPRARPGAAVGGDGSTGSR